MLPQYWLLPPVRHCISRTWCTRNHWKRKQNANHVSVFSCGLSDLQNKAGHLWQTNLMVCSMAWLVMVMDASFECRFKIVLANTTSWLDASFASHQTLMSASEQGQGNKQCACNIVVAKVARITIKIKQRVRDNLAAELSLWDDMTYKLCHHWHMRWHGSDVEVP